MKSDLEENHQVLAYYGDHLTTYWGVCLGEAYWERDCRWMGCYLTLYA